MEQGSAPEVGLIQLRGGDALLDIQAVDSELGRMGGKGPGKEGRNMDHFFVRLKLFQEQTIREHLGNHGETGSQLETRYGAEGQGPSIYIQNSEGNTLELKGPPAQ